MWVRIPFAQQMKRVPITKRGKRTIANCGYCKENFETLEIVVKNGKGKFCSNECYNNSRKSTLEKKKEQDRLHQKKHKYGLTAEQYFLLLEQQNNKCAICDLKFIFNDKKHTPCVDHCHTTGKVRGLLCHECNKGLGLFRDSVQFLKNAINYLAP